MLCLPFSNQQINVSILTPEPKALSLRIVDGMTGNITKMISSDEPFSDGETTLQVQTAELPEGAYFFQVIGSKGVVNTPFIIQRNQ